MSKSTYCERFFDNLKEVFAFGSIVALAGATAASIIAGIHDSPLWFLALPWCIVGFPALFAWDL